MLVRGTAICVQSRSHPWGLLPARTRPRGGGLQTPKWLYGTIDFVGAEGSGYFLLGIWQGEIFLFDPMCLYSKYSECCGEFKKWMKNTKKDFDPHPTSGADLG